jgi:hypothetical protein
MQLPDDGETSIRQSPCVPARATAGRGRESHVPNGLEGPSNQDDTLENRPEPLTLVTSLPRSDLELLANDHLGSRAR